MAAEPGSGPNRSRRTYRTLRVRVTAVSVALVVAVLVITAWGVTTGHHRLVLDDLDEALARTAADLEAALVAGDASPALTGFGDDDAVYQIVGPDGSVLVATANLAGAGPVAPAPPGSSRRTTVHGLPHDGADFRLRSERIEAGGRSLVVHVAAPLDDLQDSTGALRRALAVAAPAATAALGGALWMLVGLLLRRAEEAADRQERFVADASHELRTPLTRIRTELEVDLTHPGATDPLATHRLVLEEAISMQRLVDDLLVLARLDGTSPPRVVDVDLDTVVETVARDLRAEGAVGVDTSAVGATPVRGDPEQLRRLVGNLAENAARHAASIVRFEAYERDGDAILAVADDGPGIPAADHDRVFDRFARVDGARTAGTGGAGLGLAIARQIATAHGGTLRVDAEHHPGARLVLTLPGSRVSGA